MRVLKESLRVLYAKLDIPGPIREAAPVHSAIELSCNVTDTKQYRFFALVARRGEAGIRDRLFVSYKQTCLDLCLGMELSS